MPFDSLGGFEPFDDDFGEEVHDINGVMDALTAMIESGKINTVDALDAILNVMRPGATESSHDILQQFMACLHTLDAGHVADQVGAAWLSSFPWGLGLHLGVNKAFQPTESDKAAMTRALYGILKAGKSPVAMRDGKIMYVDEHGVESIVSAFREELDTEPTEPSSDMKTATEWLKRWMP